MAAPDTKKLLIYLGYIQEINGIQSYPQTVNFIDGFDDAVLALPGTVVANSPPGTLSTNPNTATFFTIVSQLAGKVWIYIKCSDSDNNAQAAIDRVTLLTQTYYSWFKKYDLLDKLAGFFLDNFGFNTSFSSGNMTRLTQIQMVQAARDLGLPVFVQAADPSDIFSPIGKNGELGSTVMPSIIGTDPTYTDKIEIRDPLITSWVDTNPQYDTTRIAEILGLVTDNLDNKYVEVYLNQRLKLDNSTSDGLLGLTLDIETTNYMLRTLNFLRCLGFYNIGITEYSLGASTTKTFNDNYLDSSWDTTDSVSGYGKLWSSSGIYYIKNKILSGQNIVDALHTFDSSFINLEYDLIINSEGLGDIFMALLRTHMSGLILSNNIATPNSKIDISAGTCSDSTNAAYMRSLSPRTLNTAVNGVDGLDTGSLASNTWYHVFLIKKTSASDVAVLCSLQATNPVMPTDYTWKRRLGSFFTDNSAHIIPFTQRGDFFQWNTARLDHNNIDLGVAATPMDKTLSVPTDIEVRWYGRVIGFNDATAGTGLTFKVLVYTPGKTSTVGGLAGGTGGTATTAAASASYFAGIYTNSSSQLTFAGIGSGNHVTVSIETEGWLDTRGKDA